MFKSKKNNISIFHEFHKPPYGGGNQFLLALCKEFKRRKLNIEYNAISENTRACLFNSFNFDFQLLERMYKPDCRMIHRVDGPISAYRGYDDGTDKRVWEINQKLAHTTIMQSNYSLKKYSELGFKFKSPHIIMNAADPRIFYPKNKTALEKSRRVRLISTSWSDNINKGAEIYKWLDENLDWDRFEYTFVGRSQVEFKRIRVFSPVSSDRLARFLRQNDIYSIASLNDPCSNALIEALSCGLPAVYLKSGGHAEIVEEAGFGFSYKEELPALFNKLVDEYEYRQSLISVPAIDNVASLYLGAMGF